LRKGIKILILDSPNGDMQKLMDAFRQTGEDEFVFETITSQAMFLERISSGSHWDVLLLDYHIGDGRISGIDLIPAIKDKHPDIPIVISADYGDVDIVKKAIEAGANDFIVRKGNLDDRVRTLIQKIRPNIELLKQNRLLQEQNQYLIDAASANYDIIGTSLQIKLIIEKIKKIALVPRPVLVTGERGTGKELVARAIHMASFGNKQPLITINCAAFTETLLASELFGYEKGAFTGADRRVLGKFELASDGTLFLDEIGHMSLSFQQKILRIVEYGTFSRVGGNSEIKVNTRIIAATNVDLEKMMNRGEFLRDLYDRLSFEVIHVPPLREREGDIIILARYFLEKFMWEIPSLRGKKISNSALSVLTRYDFPGNIRELKNIIERAAYRDTTQEITPQDLGLIPQKYMFTNDSTFDDKVEKFKASLIFDALEKSGGNQAGAARSLGLEYHQYRYWLQKYSQ